MTDLDALSDPDDERGFFVSTWCAYPDLVPDEIIMAVPEPEEEHDGGSSLYLRPHQIIHDDMPALRYLVRIRIVEFGLAYTVSVLLRRLLRCQRRRGQRR